MDVSYDDGKIEDINGIDKMPEIAIELPHSNIFLPQLTPNMLFAQASECKRLADPNFFYPPKTQYPSSVETYYIVIRTADGYEQYEFVITHQRILSMHFSPRSVLLDRMQKKRYPFPITYQQAVELFGEPDKAYNIHAARL